MPYAVLEQKSEPKARSMLKRDKDLEYKVLHIIKEAGEQGILQSQLWKKIDASSREGSRISLRLERAGLILRNRELSQGKWTYKLITKKKAVTLDTVLQTPCFFCSEQVRCGVGGRLSPLNCSLMARFAEGKPIPPSAKPEPVW